MESSAPEDDRFTWATQAQGLLYAAGVGRAFPGIQDRARSHCFALRRRQAQRQDLTERGKDAKIANDASQIDAPFGVRTMRFRTAGASYPRGRFHHGSA